MRRPERMRCRPGNQARVARGAPHARRDPVGPSRSGRRRGEVSQRLKFKPGDIESRQGLSDALWKQGKEREAVEQYRAARFSAAKPWAGWRSTQVDRRSSARAHTDAVGSRAASANGRNTRISSHSSCSPEPTPRRAASSRQRRRSARRWILPWGRHRETPLYCSSE